MKIGLEDSIVSQLVRQLQATTSYLSALRSRICLLGSPLLGRSAGVFREGFSIIEEDGGS
jgi:hypothetical protein